MVCIHNILNGMTNDRDSIMTRTRYKLQSRFSTICLINIMYSMYIVIIEHCIKFIVFLFWFNLAVLADNNCNIETS